MHTLASAHAVLSTSAPQSHRARRYNPERSYFRCPDMLDMYGVAHAFGLRDQHDLAVDAEREYETLYSDHYAYASWSEDYQAAAEVYPRLRKQAEKTIDFVRAYATGVDLSLFYSPATGKAPKALYSAKSQVEDKRTRRKAQRILAKPTPLAERLRRYQENKARALAEERGTPLPKEAVYQGHYDSPWGRVYALYQSFDSYQYRGRNGYSYTHTPASQGYLVGRDDGGPWVLPCKSYVDAKATYFEALPLAVSRRIRAGYQVLRQGDVFVLPAERATNSEAIRGTRHTIVAGVLTHPEHAPVKLPSAYKLVRAVARMSHGATRAAD